MPPLITAIVPTYRRPKLLRRAAESILAQSFHDFQLFILDNASGDETQAVARQLAARDQRVHYICHPKNIGMEANFRYGFGLINTPFFCFLCDDDVVLPHFYECAMEGFDRHPEAIFSSGVSVEVADDGSLLHVPMTSWQPGLYTPATSIRKFLTEGGPGLPESIFRRDAIDICGYFDPEEGCNVDYGLVTRLMLRHPFVIATHRPCVCFSSHAMSSSVINLLKYTWPTWGNLMSAVEKDMHIPAELRQEALELLRSGLRQKLITVAIGAAIRGNDNVSRHAVQLVREVCLDNSAALALSLVRLSLLFIPGARQAAGYLKPLRRRLRARSHMQNVLENGWTGYDEAVAFARRAYSSNHHYREHPSLPSPRSNTPCC